MDATDKLDATDRLDVIEEASARPHAGHSPGPNTDPITRRFGVFYPVHHVVAVVPDDPTARAAVEALERGGWPPSHIYHYGGEEVLERRRQFLEHRTVTDRLAELVSTVVADEREARDEYLEAAAQGAHFLIVSTPSAEQVQRAHVILAGHGAWGMRHYGDAVVTDLPSAASRLRSA
jgi:hypothetical protein